MIASVNTKIRIEPLVRIIDDDDKVSEGLAFLLDCADKACVRYASAEAFLEKDNPAVPGCLLLDIRMPGMSGLALQREMLRKGLSKLPIIFITGHGDVEMAVNALKAGAVDFLLKPVKEEKLLPAIDAAIALSLRLFEGTPSANELERRLATLSERERLIIECVREGLETLEIAERLSISPRTVQAHRLTIYRKLGVNSVERLKEIGDSRTCNRDFLHTCKNVGSLLK